MPKINKVLKGRHELSMPKLLSSDIVLNGIGAYVQEGSMPRAVPEDVKAQSWAEN